MDGCTLSPYPHLSWFAYSLAFRPPRIFVLHEYKAVTHRLVVTEEGDAGFRWRTGAAELAGHVTDGSLGFFPGDFARHSLGITAAGGYQGHQVLVPSSHLESVCDAEGAGPARDLRILPVFRDPHLLAYASRLLAGSARGHLAEDLGTEIAARQMIIRLATVVGGRPPDWLKDTSVFSPPVMAEIVARVDTNLTVRPSLEIISSGFGLSPSHFARKFRQSAGLSLNRFMNRRRIGLAVALLESSREPLAQLSLALGFCSQSHFTRLFSGLTGLSPHRFRRACRSAGG